MPEQIIAYKCQYCGSKYVRQRKHVVEEHEQWCYSRLENWPHCWDGCIHYQRNAEQRVGEYFIEKIPHYCAKHSRDMDSMKMHVRKCDHPDGLMPTKCDDFDDGYPWSKK